MAEHQSVDTFQTERLVAVRLRDEHFDEILRMHRDPKVMATLGGLRADDETARYLRDNLDYWDRYGYGIWSFSDRADGRFAGRWPAEHPRWRQPRGGAGLRVRGRVLEPGAGGRDGLGYPGGSLREARPDGRRLLHAPDNRASRRVMEKAEFGYERDVAHTGQPHVLYCITAMR